MTEVLSAEFMEAVTRWMERALDAEDAVLATKLSMMFGLKSKDLILLELLLDVVENVVPVDELQRRCALFPPLPIQSQSNLNLDQFQSRPISIQTNFNPISIHFQSILNPFLIHSQSILNPFSIHSQSILNPFSIQSQSQI